MKITQKAAEAYGVVSVVVMAGMLALMGFKAVPRSWFIPMFIAAALLYAGRFILRMIHIRQKRAAGEETPNAPAQSRNETE
jgi:TRAP-type C4-dicarboxylate transport system permease small subunit